MTNEQLIAIIKFALANGASLTGRIKAFADLVHHGHALTNDEINALELEAQADDDRRIAARNTDEAGQ